MALADFNIVGARFWLAQLEVGEEGTPHFQGTVLFKNARSVAAVRKLIPRAYVGISVGTLEQNIDYCSKSETKVEGPITWVDEPLNDRDWGMPPVRPPFRARPARMRPPAKSSSSYPPQKKLKSTFGDRMLARATDCLDLDDETVSDDVESPAQKSVLKQ